MSPDADEIRREILEFRRPHQPQQHPHEHGTFFVKRRRGDHHPADYSSASRRTRTAARPWDAYKPSRRPAYDWSEEVSRTNLLRTHTTAVSSRTLYALAQAANAHEGGFVKPQKYFSIDRVFRNEDLDATHLAEFHQVEGFVIGENLTLGHLMGTIEDFYRRLGAEFQDMKFKLTYNPYTEPSMEFCCYHPTLKKWVEVGNSGVFRRDAWPMGSRPTSR